MAIKNTQRIGIAIAITSFVTVAHAIGPGFYMGAQVGSTNLHNTARTVSTNSSPPTVLVNNPNNTGIGGRFFMGTGINEYAAFELGYTRYGSSTYKPSPSGLTGDPAIRQTGFDLTGKAMYPFQNMSVYGKLGITRIDQTPSSSIHPLSTQSANGNQYVRPLLGVGVSYELTPSWVTDLSWTRALKGGDFQNADMIAIGLAYHFVDKFCGQFLC